MKKVYQNLMLALSVVCLLALPQCAKAQFTPVPKDSFTVWKGKAQRANVSLQEYLDGAYYRNKSISGGTLSAVTTVTVSKQRTLDTTNQILRQVHTDLYSSGLGYPWLQQVHSDLYHSGSGNPFLQLLYNQLTNGLGGAWLSDIYTTLNEIKTSNTKVNSSLFVVELTDTGSGYQAEVQTWMTANPGKVIYKTENITAGMGSILIWYY